MRGTLRTSTGTRGLTCPILLIVKRAHALTLPAVDILVYRLTIRPKKQWSTYFFIAGTPYHLNKEYKRNEEVPLKKITITTGRDLSCSSDTVNFFLPLALLRASTALPSAVAMRFLNPCLLLLFLCEAVWTLRKDTFHFGNILINASYTWFSIPKDRFAAVRIASLPSHPPLSLKVQDLAINAHRFLLKYLNNTYTKHRYLMAFHPICLRFLAKGKAHEAVRGVNLQVFEGEIFGFLGPNGAGKTTTLRMLTTLLPIDEGEVHIAGYNVKTQPQEVRQRIGYVSQQGGADENATGRENLILQGQLYGMSHTDALQAADRLIEALSLSECIDRFVTTYSGGQRRRLDIALGIIHKPKIIFLDEPTTGLDPQNRANLWNQIKALQKEGITIFITSHYLDEIDFLADRLAIMDQGKIVEVGSPKELKRQISGDIIHLGTPPEQQEKIITILSSQPFVNEIVHDAQHLRLYVTQGDASLVQVLRLLDAEQISVNSISLSVPTLDDVFLKKTGHALRDEPTK
eukprot:gene10-15_t